MGYLLGIDIGSGGCKVTLLNSEKGNALTVSEEYPVYYPAPGWAEQDAGDWVKACARGIQKVLKAEGIDSSQIEAAAVGGVTHSPVLLGAGGRVLGKVMHITDTRSYRQAEELAKSHGQKILDTAFNPVEAMWTLPMLMWIKEKDRERFGKIKRILFPKDYVRYMLAGTDCTDRIDAEGTLFYSPAEKAWDRDLFSLTGLDTEVLPQVLSPTEAAGRVTRQGAGWSGLKEGTPVIVGSTDTMLEVLAAGSAKPGDCTVKLATFGRICVITSKPFSGKGLINYSYIKEGLFYPGTGTKSFATSLRWLRDHCCRDIKGEEVYSIMDGEAEDVAPGANGL
ncbi:MAG: FGGY family carbohydrate kinase, partial [Actinomycetota bacterium]